MSTNFPASLDTLTNPNPTDRVDVVSHSDQHANANDAIEALQVKVGADGSADTDSHDYKLSDVADKAASVDGTETLTNKTLTSPVLNTPDINTPDIDGGTIDDADITNPTINGTVEIDLGSDAEGDLYTRDSSGEFVRIPIGSETDVLTVTSGVPTWEDPGAAGGTNFADTSVFSGSAPSTYTDLDLSAVTGATQRMAYLRVDGGAAGGHFVFRENGTTTDQDDGSGAMISISRTGNVASGESAFVLVKTDSAGVIEWFNASTPTCTVSVEAYW